MPRTPRDIFNDAIDLPPERRAAYLTQACAGDAALRLRVDRLIEAHDDAGGLPAPSASPPRPDAPTSDFHPRAAAAESMPTREPASGEGPGTRIGPYKLLQLIGEGGFGTVFMAEQERPVVRRVALKIIKLGMDTRQVVARFEAERQALAMMDHPGIARVLDAGATGAGRPYFVMELCKGAPIAEYCDKAGLAIAGRLELFAQVCTAVQHAHTKGIIHRDLKPSNILVSTQDGRPHAKVIDFGIAKATLSKLTEKTLFTEHRQLIGTPEYMSPEQADGSLDIDTRTDVYSLGVLLYELLTGSTPFSSKELNSGAFGELQRIIREVDPPRPSTRLSQSAGTLPAVAAHRRTEPRKLGSLLRGELDWIVMKALEKDRARRYETAGALAADVRRCLAGEAVFAGPASAAYRARKFVRRHRGAAVAGSLVALAVMAGSVLAVVGFVQAGRQRDLARSAERRAVEQAARASEAEAKAVAEAESAKQIAAFLSSMLNGVAPRVALGRDTTLLREIVDGAAARIDKELAAQPAVAVRLLGIIAARYNDLGVNDKADQAARRALEIARSLPGDNRTTVAESLGRVAMILDAAGKYPDAKAMYLESCALFKAADADHSADGLTALSGLGGVYFHANDFKAAEPVFRELLEHRRILAGGQDDPELADALDRLSIAAGHEAAALPEAETLSRESLAMRRRLFGEFHPDIALSLVNLSAMLARLKRFDEANELAALSVEQHRRIYGECHTRTAAAINLRANNLQASGRFAEAVPFARLTLDINREALGPDHRTTLNNLFTLASDLSAAGDYPASEEQYRVMLAWGREHYPPGDNRTSAVIMLVAETLSHQGKHADAEPLLREALDARLAHRPAGHPQIAESRTALADCLVAQHRFADAEPLLLAVESGTPAEDPVSQRRAAAASTLAAFYASWHAAEPDRGHDARAAEWQSRADAKP